MSILLLIAVANIIVISIYNVPQLRYLMPGLFLLLICTFGLAWKHVLPRLKSFIPVGIMTLGAILLTLSALLILFSWGIYVNSYARLPWRVYAGYQTPAEFLKARTGGVDLFINHNIRSGEAVLTTGFEQLNTIKAKAIYFSYWLPPQAVGLKTTEQFESFLVKNNIRYWIVNPDDDLSEFEQLGLAQKYWTKDRLVRSLGPVDLYTLKPDQEPLPAKVIEKASLPDQLSTSAHNGDGWLLLESNKQLSKHFSIPSDANYVEGEIFVTTSQDQVTILADQVWLGMNDQEIERCVSNVVGHKQTQIGLPLGCAVPAEAHKFSVTVYSEQTQSDRIRRVPGPVACHTG